MTVRLPRQQHGYGPAVIQLDKDVVVLSLRFAPANHRIPTARHVVALLTNACCARSDDALTILTELVSNAVRHTTTLVDVTVTVDQYAVLIEVADDGDGQPVLRAVDRYSLDGGRGLRIVDLLANEWGVNPRDGDKTVWARIEADPPRHRSARSPSGTV